jgi:hypothetical protein
MKFVYDIETFRNFFLAVFYNIDTKAITKYEISDRADDREELRNFLLTKPKCIGFNNVNFDYPVLHNTILKIPLKLCTAERLYKEAGRVISQKYSAVWPNQTIVPQLDLFKIWHYDNKNKATSLKWLEFAMRSEDVRDLPYSPDTHLSYSQMDEVSDYCVHDVMETYKFYTKSHKHIKIREFYSAQENMNLINASEIKLSKEIFAKRLSEPMGMDTWDIKKLRTHRDKVEIKDVIFNYIKFNDPINKKVLDFYRNSVWLNTDEMTAKQKKEHSISYTTKYLNVERDYAEGGLHSFGQPAIYESDDQYVLIDVDFASYYPHISFKNGLHPEHIPADIFNTIYEGFYTERKKYPKSDPRNYVLKIVLNGSYGLSKDKYSLLYDPKWQLAITVNGQLLLTLLTEKIVENCEKEVKIIFENTDGAMYLLHRSDVDNLRRACSQVEGTCNIPLETVECKKVIARDVNNYINIIDDDNIKFKGAFEIDRDYNKNHSKRIIPLALANYFIHNVPPEYTIYNHLISEDYSFAKNYGIFDFLIGAKMKGNNKLVQRELLGPDSFGIPDMRDFVQLFGYKNISYYVIENQRKKKIDIAVKENKGGLLKDIFDLCYQNSSLIKDTSLSKTTRYYVSNNGTQLIKKMPFLKSKLNNYHNKSLKLHLSKDMSELKFLEIQLPERETNIESGWLCTVMNKIKRKEDYDINYDYYISEAYKIIDIFKI